MATSIAVLGDDRGYPSHRELTALLPRLADELGVRARWVPTASDFDLAEFDGVWLVPSSQYEDEDAVTAALATVRRDATPFLASCAGMQFVVVDHLRHVLGRAATFEEYDGVRDDNAISALPCPLNGERRMVVPVPGTRFAGWSPTSRLEMHYCGFAPHDTAVAALVDDGVVVGARTEDGTVEVLEFGDHPFFVASLFHPHIGASSGAPIHPLIRAFVAAASARSGDRAEVPSA